MFALGIHEDTGSLTFSTTTTRDAEALAYCMRAGADIAAAREVARQRAHAGAARHPGRRAAGGRRAAHRRRRPSCSRPSHEDLYVEGVSVVAHRVMDLTGCDAYFLLVEMEGRVFVTGAQPRRPRGRGRGAARDRRRRSHGRRLGGGQGPLARRGRRRGRGGRARGAWRRRGSPATRSSPGRPWSTPRRRSTRPPCSAAGTASAVSASLATALLVGRVALTDLERASAHGLGHAPVKAVMTTRVPLVWAADAARARGPAARSGRGRLAARGRRGAGARRGRSVAARRRFSASSRAGPSPARRRESRRRR